MYPLSTEKSDILPPIPDVSLRPKYSEAFNAETYMEPKGGVTAERMTEHAPFAVSDGRSFVLHVATAAAAFCMSWYYRRGLSELNPGICDLKTMVP
ncbi:unnamed protein product [Dibothriocephalus latus]|uniref:Uncharacterized protein n=1 Tax=Dibothriocephalus latus TaxID=60516 RepID=A0A3P7MEL9_DIBLA|nr:unnamed protein product [Dibothriocephalus latus]